MNPAPQELRTYFVTTPTAYRRRLFQVEEKARLMVEVLFHYLDQNKFSLHAFAVMPDHIHLLITPSPMVSLEKSVQLVKGGSSFRLKSKLGVWARGYSESQIISTEKYFACKKYIEMNPVRARMTSVPEEFKFSSANSAWRLDALPPQFLKARG